MSEGDPVDADTVKALRKRYDALTPEQRAWCDAIKQQAETAERGIALGGPTGKATLRRWNITRGLILLAEFSPEDAVLEAVLDIVSFTAIQGSIPLGAYVGDLTVGESDALCVYAEGLGHLYALVFTDDGRAHLEMAA